MEWGKEASAPGDGCAKPRRRESSFCAVLLLSLCLRSHPLLFNVWNIPGSILSFPDVSLGLGPEEPEGPLSEMGGDKQSKLAGRRMAQLVETDSSSGARGDLCAGALGCQSMLLRVSLPAVLGSVGFSLRRMGLLLSQEIEAKRLDYLQTFAYGSMVSMWNSASSIFIFKKE